MDANGTKFHLLLGRDDFGQCTVDTPSGKKRLNAFWDPQPSAPGAGLIWNEERGELTLESRLFKFIAAPDDTKPLIENRRGAAQDRYGNWYWIDETTQKIRVRSIGSGQVTDFWPLEQTIPTRSSARDFEPLAESQSNTPLKFAGLAITTDHYLVVGVTNPAGLLIFDLHTGGEPQQLLWPKSIPFTPFDMAPRPGGGVYILDSDEKSYWALDRHFNPIGPEEDGETVLAEARNEDFQPMDESEVRSSKKRVFPKSFSLVQSPIALIKPIAIEALPDGTVLILDHDPSVRFSKIYRYRLDQLLDDQISTEAILNKIEESSKDDFSLRAYDIAFVPKQEEAAQDRLYVVAADGNQSYAFRVCLRDEKIELQAIGEFLPMRLFGGKALVGTPTGAYYDFAEDWIPLVQQRRPRYVAEATFETPLETALARPYFDGGEPDCVWHRIMLDAHIPPDTKIEIWSRASNEAIELPLLPWQREPAPYLRGDGSELPFLRASISTACGLQNQKIGAGTWELLFQRERGRFLQLRIRLSGDERSTPRLRALRAYYPRFSYLSNYLPGVYREDQQSASFLDRFLSNVEGMFTSLEDKIAATQVLFDVRSAPRDVLDWLGGWFGVALDPSWDEARRRMFITHAMDFFQYRGTIRGLTMALHLALDKCADESIFIQNGEGKRPEEIRIVERYRTRTLPGVIFGDTSQATGLRAVNVEPSWRPEQGRANLLERYITALGPDATAPTQYPLVPPADAAETEIWIQFSLTTLGFVPSSASSVTLGLWRDFLARRYRRINAYNTIYGTSWTSFESIPFPNQLPLDGAPLADWFQFESVVLRMQRAAHRFTVLLPVPLSIAFNPEEHQRRLELSRRIVELEKPAHTVFDVKFYWAMFRVGEARLQLDTVIDQGSRAPQLLPELVLGQGFLGESYLAPPVPENARDRMILGRDQLQNS